MSIAENSSAAPEDSDPAETREWLESLEAMAHHVGPARAAYVLKQLEAHAQYLGVAAHAPPYSAYQNTIPLEQQSAHPGDVELEERITAIIRWNALAMVVRANKAYGQLGGHIASYASAAEIFELGFNHFFRARSGAPYGDLVFFQPHSAPGIYARAFLEGRLSEEQLANFRQEVQGRGLCSYPHPWLMPQFWQFPTGSMGIGPINSIYHARFMRYLEHRKLADTAERHVWGVFGDGEMDEPESVAALTLAARENLDNLTFIINCNLQRLDGPVRGNGQIIQELESLFTGAGWNVIKVLWGSDWDALFARDRSHALLHRFATTVDGQYQTLGANAGAYNQTHFFALDPELRSLVAHMSLQQIDALRRGGHDFRKLYAAFAAARAHRGQPTVILAKTKKGYGMGRAGESRMTAHQEKKIDVAALLEFRDRFELPLSDTDVAQLRFLRPSDDSREMRYLKERRAALGGSLPARSTAAPRLSIPPLESYASFTLAAEGKEMSTTMAAVRLLTNLLRDKTLGPPIVPIVADEARTFGMAGLFKQIGIYAPAGQLYEPEDASSLLAYRESREGQLLEEGITEAGALSSWIAAATAYSVHGSPMHGASHVFAATVPNCRAYDPAFACELAVILDHGMRRMLQGDAEEFYYVTVMNENYAQPSLPADAAPGIIRGLYRFSASPSPRASLHLLGSGAILLEVIAARELLWRDWQISADVWSATSFTELAREARASERWNRLHPQLPPVRSYVAECLDGDTPIIAATDYVCAYPQSIAPYLEAPFVALGTDGFGRSDTRARLRGFFEVDRHHITVAALQSLVGDAEIAAATVSAAIERYGIDGEAGAPWLR
jgi:pyruvate dehydrogenase E1 component